MELINFLKTSFISGKKIFFLVEISVREFFQNGKNRKNKWKYYNKVLFINRDSWKERNRSMNYAVRNTARFLSADKPTKTRNKAFWV